MKKYKRGQELLYTATGNNTPLRCKVLCNQLEPGGGNLDTALITIKAEKMANPVSIPVQDQDDYLREPNDAEIPARVQNPKKWFWVFAALLFFVPAANAQNVTAPVVFSPRIKSALETGEQIDPPKVLGIFKNERRAGFWLTFSGVVGMTSGAFLQGRAAHIIQTEGHTSDWDRYERTRTPGLVLTSLGAASYGGGFVYRSKSWYKKRPWLWGSVEAVGWMFASKYISEAAYRGRSRE